MAQSSAGTVLSQLKSRVGLIRRLAEANNVRDVAVFGSVAREEDGPDSDIDLVVTATDRATYFDLAQFQMDVESLMGRNVDVVSRGGFDAEKSRQFLRGAIPL